MLDLETRERLLSSGAIARVYARLHYYHGSQVAENYLAVMSRSPQEFDEALDIKKLSLPEDGRWLDEVKKACEVRSRRSIARICGVDHSSFGRWLHAGCPLNGHSLAKKVYLAWMQGSLRSA